jgi:hypothetical protein
LVEGRMKGGVYERRLGGGGEGQREERGKESRRERRKERILEINEGLKFNNILDE